ncbi:MAG: phosphotransferase [Novosphingobium sp.]|nr:phosphotransferase [Novosphingobium sp.]MCP5402919.1 phosphotransferase [Novosphingobium sp.]
MTATELPTGPEGLELEMLSETLSSQVPGAALEAFRILDSHLWGSGDASSAGRIDIEVDYTPSSPEDLPRRIVAKIARVDPDDTPERRETRGGLYANEVNVYTRFDPARIVEAPRVLGGTYDPASHHFLLLLEDLRERDVAFANVTVPTSLDRMRSLLSQLAKLHALYWNSPELGTSLGWMEHHTRGRLYDMFNTPEIAPAAIAWLVENVQFKREMVERMGQTPDSLFRQFQRIQAHQATLARTVCHGDMHIGNSYILPDGTGGLIDWQLTSQGYCMHDISYLLGSGLSVAQRREHERELLAYYREQLCERGVADAPGLDELWLEYRRAMVWGVYIGWLTTPEINYGWEITVMNHLRVMTAYEDLETAKALAELG